MLERATLIYNPRCGRSYRGRKQAVHNAAAVFREAGIEVGIARTEGPGDATELARRAAEQGCDAVIACGGDGTVLEVLQGVANTGIGLSVIPMGTKNALAWALGVPADPAKAACALIDSVKFRVAAGKLTCQRPGGGLSERYFLSVAGVGADAEMMYRLATGFQRGLGMLAYYREGFRVFLSHDYREFEAEIRTPAGETHRERVSDLLAVRSSTLGGLLSRLAPGAGLHTDTFRLVLFKSRRRWPYLVYAAGVASRSGWRPPEVELLEAVEVRCTPLAGEKRVCVEADGEFLGNLPATIGIAPGACVLLAPRESRCGKRVGDTIASRA